MKNGNAGLKRWIVQVGVKLRQACRHHQALVQNDVRRQRADEEIRVLLAQFYFSLAAGHKQIAIKFGGIHVPGCGHVELFDSWHRFGGFTAAGIFIDGHFAPAIDSQPARLQPLRESQSGAVGALAIATEENHACCKQAPGRKTALCGAGAQKLLRLFQQQTATVARFAVCRNGTTVCHSGQCLHSVQHQRV